jgi:hypothetical protein
VRDTEFQSFVWVYQPATIYYFVADEATAQPSFEEIKAKQLKYDYYGDIYQMGEHIDANEANNYTITISNLEYGRNYTAYVWVEALSGTLAVDVLQYSLRLPSIHT